MMVRPVVTGVGWMGGGIGSVETALELLIRSAQQELLITAYAVGTAADRFLHLIDGAAARGVQVGIVVNRIDHQPPAICSWLQTLQRDHEWCAAYEFHPDNPNENLHAKVIVADSARAIVGSANLSGQGLYVNYELGLSIEGAPVAEVAQAIRLLIKNPRLVRRLSQGL